MIKQESALTSRINMPLLLCTFNLANLGDEHLAPLQFGHDQLLRVVLLQSGQDPRFEGLIISYERSYVGEDVVHCGLEAREERR